MDLPDPDRMKNQFLEATTPPDPRIEYTIPKTPETLPSEDEAEIPEEGLEETSVQENLSQQLDEFYKQLIYDIPRKSHPRKSTHIDRLAKPKKLAIGNTYLYKDVLQPKGRKKRIKREVTELGAMTTEQLEEYLQNLNRKKRDNEKLLQKRHKIHQEMQKRLERQSGEQILNHLFEKFSNYLCQRAVQNEGSAKIYPANVQRLIDCIEHNIFETCKIPVEEQKNNETLYKSLANTIGCVVVETLCEAEMRSASLECPQKTDEGAEKSGTNDFKSSMEPGTSDKFEKRRKTTLQNEENVCLDPLPDDDDLLKLITHLRHQ